MNATLEQPATLKSLPASELQGVRAIRSSDLLGDGQSTNLCADDARVACPLFQAEYGGSKPTSALQLKIAKMPNALAIALNRKWHSRIPEMGNWRQAEAYGAECGNVWYAVAFWSNPVARLLNGRGMWELRRMAIAPDAPKNTGSRMLKIMAMLIAREKPELQKLVSYQDTAVHKGTIYKAAGWTPVDCSKSQSKWNMPGRPCKELVTANSVKVRWELTLRESPNHQGQR